jgi:serine/threonine protein kinase
LRRHINGILQKTSDDLIDLIESMLKKEATERIEVLQIFEHPWMVKYRAKAEKWSDDEGDESDSSSSLAASNLSFDKSEQDEDEDS